ncbi:MAG TPA: sodium:solute symporter [Thermoanaerobaculia bacterium]
MWKNHRVETLHGYLLANQSARWYTVLVSIMATQASAITFLSTPGQAYADGMRFVQFYFGLPFAMIVLAITAVPLYHRLRVFTAYEFLEKRFDLKTRTFATLLFLVSRGLSTGISIYATSLVLSVLLGWSLPLTNLVIGGLVVVYTTSGGSRAVNWTQSWQFLIAIGGMVVALVVIVRSLPEAVSLAGATRVADQLGRLNVVDFRFDLTNRYNFWSGLVGGFFLALAYFGTDQSQVGRYLGGRSIEASRLGLLFNGLLKVPMQFFILFVGAMVFVFYQFVPPPVLFNPAPLARLRNGPHAGELLEIESRHRAAFESRRAAAEAFVKTGKENESAAAAAGETLRAADASYAAVRAEAVALVKAHDLPADANDTNYVFLSFVLAHLPTGLVGLILAVVFAASMSSNSAALNSLASTSVVDVYVRLVRKNRKDSHYLAVSRIATALWGAFSISVAMYANRVGTLIEAVNILGSLFYGTMLGIFLVAFYLPRVRGTPVFAGGVAGLASVWACFAFTRLSYLWFNVVGCVVVIGVALALTAVTSSTPRSSSPAP